MIVSRGQWLGCHGVYGHYFCRKTWDERENVRFVAKELLYCVA